jgi:glycogen synthase
MLGWEFPPYISGGLGTACYGLTCAMEHLGLDIVMLLPANTERLDGKERACRESSVKPGNLSRVEFMTVPYKLPNPYRSCRRSHPVKVFGTGQAGGYDGNLIDRVLEYAQRCIDMVKGQTFDVIHAHDWVTFPAAVALSELMQKPLVVQIHATEIDRSGQNVNRAVYDIERKGMEKAAAVIAVSHYTAGILTQYYDVPADKIHVVHNGINPKPIAARPINGRSEAVVLFLGRITSQKGPEYFVNAAEKVLRRYDNVKFVMAGWGDMAPYILEMVASKRLGSKILFTGFLRGRQVEIAYRMSDVYVMPSVSEPFGITALEAVQNRIPVILSKTTGVGEILQNGALKTDFWDTNRMSEQILEVLKNPPFAERLRCDALNEIQNLTWDTAARKCQLVYAGVCGREELIEQDN